MLCVLDGMHVSDTSTTVMPSPHTAVRARIGMPQLPDAEDLVTVWLAACRALLPRAIAASESATAARPRTVSQKEENGTRTCSHFPTLQGGKGTCDKHWWCLPAWSGNPQTAGLQA
jgi:hypothetical protein